jgi:hypothetical protein
VRSSAVISVHGLPPWGRARPAEKRVASGRVDLKSILLVEQGLVARWI